MLRFSLNRVNIIEAREDISERFLHNLETSTPIIATADPVFLLREQGTKPSIKLESAKLQVGLTVRKWFSQNTQLERYIDAIAETIDYLASVHGAHIYYLPQVIATNFGDDDRLIAERVQAKVSHKSAFTLLTEDLHPLELIGFCKKMDIFIGTRMHSNIFALINAIPVVAIEYEHKTRGIMRGLGLEEFVISIDEVTPQILKNRTEELLAHRSMYSELIQSNMTQEIARSQNAIEVIKRDYSESLA